MNETSVIRFVKLEALNDDIYIVVFYVISGNLDIFLFIFIVLLQRSFS